jgi:uncharacterized protein (TIGR03435 family)
MRITIFTAALVLRCGHAQTVFEAASVRPAPLDAPRVQMTGGVGSSDPGRLHYENFSLADLVRQAFALKPYQLAAPNWLGTERFDITAVIPHGATRPQFREMLQNLLAERFRMTYHRASKIVPQYALAISPKGHKLRAAGAAPDRSQSPPESEGYPSFEGPGMIVRNGRARLQLDQETLAQLAGRLANQIGQPVLDATGLTDKFSFSLYWVTDAEGPGESGPGIFQAVQEQLGLQLRPQKGPIEVLVVDTMEKTPSGN